MSTGTCSEPLASGMRGFIAKNTSKLGARCGMAVGRQAITGVALAGVGPIPPLHTAVAPATHQSASQERRAMPYGTQRLSASPVGF